MKLPVLCVCTAMAAVLLRSVRALAAADDETCLLQTHAQVDKAKQHITESKARASHEDEVHPPCGASANGSLTLMSRWPWEKTKGRAMHEAGVNCSTLSYYGANAYKVTNETVEKVIALKLQLGKLYRFNFQGTLTFPSYYFEDSLKDDRREWVLKFAKDYFRPDDYLVVTRYIGGKPHQPLGPYDHTYFAWNQPPETLYGPWETFDIAYWAVMAQSWFTLCPGGDTPWSMRFYEAILAGSIPVINSADDDYSGPALWFNRIGYTYFTTEQVVNMETSEAELSSIAKQNLDLFLKYQTFRNGDLVPPAYSAEYGGKCTSSNLCADRCFRGVCKEPDEGIVNY